jgi:glycosyltransferase involved in cell wall biosynthesis
MRVLITADPELPVPPSLYGGIERVIDILVRELKALGHTVGLLAHRDSQSPADGRFSWPGLHSQHGLDLLRNSSTLKSVIGDFKPDVVHSFSRVMYLLPLLPSRIPKIMSYQRRPSPRTVKYGSKLGRNTLSFTGCSDPISAIIRSVGGSVRTIHNCVELGKYKYQPEVDPDAPLVFLSRVERIKGAHTAIKVARAVGKRLIIAGNHATGGEEGRYWQEEIIPHIGKGDVEYIGAVNDKQKNQLLGRAAAMIVPIEWDEPFGIVFAEALACGTPVISCPRGALPEIVRHGVDGFLVGDIAEACNAVSRLGELKRSECRQRVEQCFSSSVIARKYEQLYRDVVESSA